MIKLTNFDLYRDNFDGFCRNNIIDERIRDLIPNQMVNIHSPKVIIGSRHKSVAFLLITIALAENTPTNSRENDENAKGTGLRLEFCFKLMNEQNAESAMTTNEDLPLSIISADINDAVLNILNSMQDFKEYRPAITIPHESKNSRIKATLRIPNGAMNDELSQIEKFAYRDSNKVIHMIQQLEIIIYDKNCKDGRASNRIQLSTVVRR